MIHIPCGDSHRHNKDANLIEKVLAACRAGVSKKFVRMSDDELFLKNALYSQMVPLHYGDLHQKPPSFFAGNWKIHLRNTRDRLVASNLGAVHFDTHTPNAYDRDSFVRIMDAQGVVFPGQGNRLSKKWPLPRCVLVVEDTASSGNAITEAAAKAAKNWPHAKIIKAAVYASSRGAKACDLVGKIYERPHFLEWNFPNAWIYANMAYDFDGIFCEDCPKEADDDGPRYEEFLRNAKPKYLPRKYPVKLIVTARLEKWRPQTEAWLHRHRIAFRELAMGPWPNLVARRAAHDVDKFKAYCLVHSSCYAFAESEPAQAESICRLARKPVLCPAARRFFIPPGYSWPRMSKLLKA